MAGMAEQSVQRAVEAYRTRDISICDLMDREEQAIDRFEREIDQMALDVLAMEHPVAIDLRFTLAVIKIDADLERVGNAASIISRRVRDLEIFPVVDPPIDIPRMASLAGMVRNALLAFIEADSDIAQSVLSINSVDRLNDKAQLELSSLIERQPELTPQALNTMIIARSLQDVADQSKNVAADVIFWVRGADVRQHASHAGKA
jgi:phosphate transport system protein